MKNSTRALTFVFLFIGMLTSCASNKKHYQNIGCYSYQTFPLSTQNENITVDVRRDDQETIDLQIVRE
jgi:predicted component of type VI protein secretion system